MGLSMKPVNF